MKTMSCAMAFSAVAVLMCATGCGNGVAMQPAVRAVTPAAADGEVCPSSNSGRPGPSAVYVDVAYAMDGTPSAVPNKCFVDNGATVTWRDPPDRTTQFNLVFADNVGGTLRAAQAARRYKLSAVIEGKPGQQFKYGIQANGKTVDPAIIIK